MHDYTARLFYEDRHRQFEREAAASRLAWEARQGRPRRRLSTMLRELIGPSFARWTQWQVHRGLQEARDG